jgi:hypothetical protein
MPETMRGLWDRYRAASSAGIDSPESVGLRAALVRALSVTGPVYARDLEGDTPIAWLGLHREDGRLMEYWGTATADPRVAPGRFRGDGVARDAGEVMVPESSARRDRERLL